MNCGQEKRTGDYEKDWNDTPAGKKAVIAGRQLTGLASIFVLDKTRLVKLFI